MFLGIETSDQALIAQIRAMSKSDAVENFVQFENSPIYAVTDDDIDFALEAEVSEITENEKKPPFISNIRSNVYSTIRNEYRKYFEEYGISWEDLKKMALRAYWKAKKDVKKGDQS